MKVMIKPFYYVIAGYVDITFKKYSLLTSSEAPLHKSYFSIKNMGRCNNELYFLNNIFIMC